MIGLVKSYDINFLFLFLKKAQGNLKNKIIKIKSGMEELPYNFC